MKFISCLYAPARNGPRTSHARPLRAPSSAGRRLSSHLYTPHQHFQKRNSTKHPKTPRIRDSPRSVLSRVSFASHTSNQPPFCAASESKAVTVKHAPFTAIESPMWQSPKIGAASAIVSVHPPASCTMAETVPRCSIYEVLAFAFQMSFRDEG